MAHTQHLRQQRRRVLPHCICDGLERRILLSMSLVFDHNNWTADSNPGPVIDVNGTLFFSAYTTQTGRELFKSDGTAAGTTLVRDINPDLYGASYDSSPASLTRLGNQLLFYASTIQSGYELWKSDGTAAGTVLVKDIAPGSATSADLPYPNQPKPPALVVFKDKIFFNARSANGMELWSSDGTTAGTTMVKDIASGSGSSDPKNLLVAGDTLYFIATDPIRGIELWKSDGSAEGTTPITNLTTVSSIDSPVFLNGSVFFRANSNQLWRTDNSPTGASLVKAFNTLNSGMAVSNGVLFFAASSGSSGGLWKSDGTAIGTVRIQPAVDPMTGLPSGLVDFNGSLLFAAATGSGVDQKIWRSDGTPQGTRMVDNTAALYFCCGADATFTLLNGRAYFSGYDEFGGRGAELWQTDGTPQNTRIISDLMPGPDSSRPGNLTVAGDKLYFSAVGPQSGREVYFTNGGEPSQLLADMNSNTLSSDPSALLPFAGKYFYTATDPIHGREIWTTDGTAQGTSLFLDLNPGPGDGIAFYLDYETTDPDRVLGVVTEQGLFFIGTDASGVATLWKTDGTPGGTVKVIQREDVYALFRLAAAGNRLFMVGDTLAEGGELWTSDGAAEGTHMVKDIWPGRTGSSIKRMTGLGDLLLFQADDGVHGDEIWRSDGTAEGTYMLRDIYPGYLSGSLMESSQYQPIVYNHELYFNARSPEAGLELWKSDGTVAGTVQVADINPGTPGSAPVDFHIMNGILYFRVQELSNNLTLWRTDGTAAGTYRVTDAINVSSLTVVGSRIFISNRGALWVSDGTAGGTHEVSPGFSIITKLVSATDGRMVFFRDTNGFLLRSDGNTSSEFILKGPGTPLHTNNERWLDGALYFTATTTEQGAELWKFVPPEVKSVQLKGRNIVVNFSDDVINPANDDPNYPFSPLLRNVTTGQTINLFARLDPGTHHATFTLPADLAEGHYQFILDEREVTDSFGNPMVGSSRFYFLNLSGSSADDAYRVTSTAGNQLLVYKENSPTPQFTIPFAQLNAILLAQSTGRDSLRLSGILPEAVGIELGNSTLVVETIAAQRGSDEKSLHAAISEGRITSAMVDSNSSLVLGMISDESAITIRPVWRGDLNLDGSVSISDFLTLASNFNKTNATYAEGDINYDGTVSIADFIDLAANFNASLPSPAVPPQPAAALEVSIPGSTSSPDVVGKNPVHKLVQTKAALIMARAAKHHRKRRLISRF